VSLTISREGAVDDPNAGGILAEPHLLNSAIEHPEWCEWSGLIPRLSFTTGVMFRCPGCWGAPSPYRSTTD
jgi:hypothetical protein